MDTAQLYTRLAAAAVRGYAIRTAADIPDELREKHLNDLSESEMDLLLEAGKRFGMKLYRFKRGHETLPRVRFVLGFLKAVSPESLCDIGSGRGVFLFPLLDAFPGLPVTSVDILEHRTELLRDMHRGGIANLSPMNGDFCTQPVQEKSADIVTALEVLEHIPDVQAAINAAVRTARRYVVVTVPSKADNNPEHIHLLTKSKLTDYFIQAGCIHLQFGGVPNHLTLIAAAGE